MRAWRARRLPPLPPWLSRTITLPILLALGSLFFFTPVEIDRNVADLVVAACQKGNAAVVQAVMSALQKLPGGLGA